MQKKYCTNCGKKIDHGIQFCPHCGTKIESGVFINDENASIKINQPVETEIIKSVNKKIKLQNNQSSIVKRLWYAAGFFFILMILPFQKWSPVAEAWGLAFISFFLFLVTLISGFMFRSREKKLDKLISGKTLIAHWTLTPKQKKNYSNYLFKREAQKNLIILLSISVIAIIVWGIFILFIDEGKLFMILALIALLIFISAFAFGMPYYYRYKNNKGDGKILIGEKYAYINGYFHNWDFPLSGLSKIKRISQPFYGLDLVYYYTDRTLKHNEELIIPVSDNIDLKALITALKNSNKKH